MNIRLGLCSAYSLLYGVHKPEKILDKAASYAVNTASICDINSLYGVHSFIEAAKEKNIRPIIGAALTKGETFSPAIYCIAENRAGFARLCEILTLRNKDVKNFDPAPHLQENAEGLILASFDKVLLSLLAGRVKRLYAAITQDNLTGVSSSRELSLPLAFLDTSLFLESSDYAVHKVLRAIGLNKTTGSLSPGDTAAKGSGIFKTSEELLKYLDSWPDAVKGTKEIARIAQFNSLFDGYIFPSYGDEPGNELRRRTYEGAALRYGALGDGEIERIEYELDIIDKMGFSPYFLRIDDIVKMAKTTIGCQTCGRGSGAASIVSYALQITNVDPIGHNLYFERFLNPARPDPPDIDIDFAWDERDNLIKAVIEKFGAKYCARVANHNFFRGRSALRETAKAYGFSDAEITGMERKLHTVKDEPLWQEILLLAAKIEGLPRGIGMHCGGIVITPEPVKFYCPVEKSLEGYPLLAWEKDGTEAAGFVKIDLLGNRSLAVIRDVINSLELEHDDIVSRLSRAISDPDTIEALARGDSMGVFYIESPAMRQLQKKTGKGDFEHIVIHSSIIRPAANKFICEYVDRLKGNKWDPLHPRLEYILNETYGILCYQEDVSKTAIALADFNEVDADKLRKVISKKAGAARLAVYEKQFFDGCRKNGVSEQTIKTIWEMMLSFDGYSFCKPHSASYAMVSFQSAYLRVHYPACFMAAVLSNQGGFYSSGAYISESRRMGLITEGPDVNLSEWKYYGITNEKIKDNYNNNGYLGTIIIGLMAIKGLSAKGAQEIIDERKKNGNFLSLEDFSKRVRLNRDDIIALCPAGVFDSISNGLPRQLQARKLLSMISKNCNTKNGELFANEDKSIKIISPHLWCAFSFLSSNLKDDDLKNELEALGFLRKLHPLALWKNDILRIKDRVTAQNIGNYVNKNVKMTGWPITQKDVWTKDGLTMSFLSLEDETAMYETVIFPQVYSKYSSLLFDRQPLLIYGRVVNDQGAISLEIAKIEKLPCSI